MLLHINFTKKILIYCINLLNLFNFHRILYAFLNHVFFKPITVISNYIFLHVNSKTNAGGVAMYIRDIVKFRICRKQHELTNSEAL